jgi:DNA polymerase II small subunit
MTLTVEAGVAPAAVNALERKKQVVAYLMKHGMLVTPAIIGKLADPQALEKLHALAARQAPIDEVRQALGLTPASAPEVVILRSYDHKGRKGAVDDFVQHFRVRYKQLSSILKERAELGQAIAVSRLKGKQEKERVALIGYITDKVDTKAGNIMITLEDLTGTVKVVFSKSREDVYAKAKDLVFDEVIGVTGQGMDGIVFGSDIIIPDIPVTHELKKAPIAERVVMVSDIHIGSKLFLKEEFERFIRWLRGEEGTPEQRSLAAQVRYLLIVGDAVDGVGIYPKQVDELAIPDIYEQYKVFAEYVKQIPQHIRVVICAGNHDGVRIPEPQPVLPADLAPGLHGLPNVTLVSNPAWITIGRTQLFGGFDVLLYHGYSFDDYGDMVESIRKEGKTISDRVNPVMRFLLQRRHLAPRYDTTQFIVDPTEDALVIDRIPDFFFAGHEHNSSHSNYRGVTLISGSCWQSKTAFQEKLGHTPDMCKVPVINLQTRDVTVIDFASSEGGEQHVGSQ